MKCPKCGYTSFETNDSCRKCSADLIVFRQTHGLTPLVLPDEVRRQMVAELGISATDESAQDENGNDNFSFDLPQHDEPTAAAPSDPFAFNAPSAAPAAAPVFSFDTPAPAVNDPFAELLESTPSAPKSAPAAQPAAETSSGQGFELNSFSWDDTPEPAAAGAEKPQEQPKKQDDDFSSLFGDLGGEAKK